MTRTHKYNARKTERDGHIFDSKKEADYYQDLKYRQMAGEIIKIELQPEYELIPGFVHQGKKYQASKYKPDFRITFPDGRVQVIEIKGYSVRDWPIRKKLFLANNPDVDFLEVKPEKQEKKRRVGA